MIAEERGINFMYKRLSAIMFPIAAVLLVGAMVWGYLENQEKNSILIKAENQYQRAFHDLTFHVDKLHSELGKALAVNSASQDFQRKCLLNVWRFTSEAQSEINQLPLTLLPFNKTEEFLANIANFSYRVSVRDLGKEPLSPDEMKNLKTLYKRSKEISADLRDVQSKVLNKNLRWMDVELALASEREPLDNSIIDGFKTVDKRVNAYSEVNFGPSIPSIFNTNRSFNSLSGPQLSTEDIKTKAAQFLGISDSSAINVVENGAGTEYNSYSVSVNQGAEDEEEDGQNGTIHMDFTKRGGELIWYLDNRPVQGKSLSIDQARDSALKFLQRHNYNDMRAISFDEYQNVASIVFARTKDDVILFPEKVTVQVALDNGEINGFQASDYVFEHKERNLKAPSLTLEQAKKKLNPKFKVTSDDLALIDNDLNKEVLCYLFLGKINGTNYRIYINAETGIEEKLEEITTADAEAGKS
jgi:spore germination protein